MPLRTYVAVFGTPATEGMPVVYDVVDHNHRFSLYDVPDGVWHIRAAAVKYVDVHPRPSKRRPMFVGGAPAITVKAGQTVETHLNLREVSVFDLPVLQAIPELDCRELPAPVRIEAGDACPAPEEPWRLPFPEASIVPAGPHPEHARQ
jgi:hypothetical protein